MTIHSDWARILHDECPDAFSAKPPALQSKYEVGIIDGHLQLMRLDVRMQTWECFIRNQFLKPMYEMLDHGCSRVVLCFDDYANVPLYKAMTQKARVNKVEVKVFGSHEELPPVVPDDPMLYLMNRNFKIKLIEMLCLKIPQMLVLEKHQVFILDYKKVVFFEPSPDQPVKLKESADTHFFSAPSQDERRFFPAVTRPSRAKFHLSPSPCHMAEMLGMGESDVKFTRYVTKYGSALVHAIDGDYMAIALLYYTRHGLHDKNKIFIYRQISVLPSSDAAANQQKKMKRKLSANEDEASSEQRKAGKKCWVDIQLIFLVIAQAMRQSGCAQAINTSTCQAFTDGETVYAATFLMLCAGTDFSRNIPLIGPKRIWETLPEIAVPALQSLRGGVEGVNERMFLDMVAARLYSFHFSKHVSMDASKKKALSSPPTFESIMQALKESKLSSGTRDRLPSIDRMKNTIKNLVWVTHYWSMENGSVETPLDGEYGYCQDRSGGMNFQDLVALG